MPTTKKRRMHKFRIREITPVDRPAQEGAVAVLLKSFTEVTEEELVKVTFAEALTELKLEDKLHDILGEQFVLNEALRRSVREIVENKDEYPEPVEAVKTSLQQFASAVRNMVSDAVENLDDDQTTGKQAPTKTEGGSKFPASDYAYVPDKAKPSTWKLRLTSTPGGKPDPRIVGAAVAALGPGFRGQKVQLPSSDRAAVISRVRAAWLKANPNKTKDDLPSVLKSENGGKQMSDKDKTPTLEDVQKSLEETKAELEVSKKYGELSDEDKTYYKSLDDEGKSAFLEKSPEERQADVAKSKEDDKVVYTDLDGNEYRKSDDARVVAAVKRADDATRKLEKKDEELADERLEKRAKEELPNLPGEDKVKVAVLKAVDGIEDEDLRKGAIEMLKSHNAAVTKATETSGHRDQSVADAEEQLRKMAQDHYDKSTADDKTFEKSYAEVIKTDTGKKLYKQVLTSSG